MRTGSVILDNFPEFKPDFVEVAVVELDPRGNEATDFRLEKAKQDRADKLRRANQMSITGITEDDLDKAELAAATSANTAALVNQASQNIIGSRQPVVIPSDDSLRREATAFLDEYLEERRRNRDDDFGD